MSKSAVNKIACRAIIVDQGQILTVRLNPTDDFYCLPWGKIDKMETLHDCMVREIYEELGVKADVGPLLFIHEWLLTSKKKHILEFFFLITNWPDFRDIDFSDSSHGFEIDEICWVDLYDTTTNLQPSFVLEHLQGKTIEHIMSMWTQSVVSC